MKQFISTIVLLLASGWAHATVLDFENFSAGTIMDTEYAALGVTIAAVNLGGGPDLAVVFDSRNPTGGDGDLGAPFSNPVLGSASPGNLLIIQENDNCDAFTCTTPDDEGSRPAGQLIIGFEEGVFLESIDFFDVEGVESHAGSSIELYDDENVLIPSSFFVPDTGGDNMWSQVFFGVSQVKTIVINMGGSGAIDNIVFQPRVVPVPAALPLLLTALAGLGVFRRRN